MGFTRRRHGIQSCLTVIATVVLVSCSSLLLQAITRTTEQNPPPGPQLPVPSGRFGIGRAAYDFVDTSRAAGVSAVPGFRELMVYVWYPIAEKRPGIRGAYLPGAEKMDGNPESRRWQLDDYESVWPMIVSGSIFSHAADGAAPAKAPRSFPLVIFSHGLGGSGFQYTSVIEDLVSRGYVVAAIEHPGAAGVVVFPDGRIVVRHPEQPPADLPAAERSRWVSSQNSALMREGAADVRFVLDRLTELNAGDQRRFVLARRLDLTRVAAMGHSAGAEFAARACQLDARFKACVDLDGGMVPVAALPDYADGAAMKQPLLFLEAYHPESRMGGTHAQLEAYFKKKEDQLQQTRPGSYDVTLHSAGMIHGSFSDMPLLAANGRGEETRSALHNLQLVQNFIHSFLSKTLNHTRETLLDVTGASASEAEVKAYGR